ncbi:MAG: RNA pseudouridine synthase [Candidatus Delongbacteria bacterium]|nr:RNA pseudouridine synthase [Candidatus Delongbacteria bacterium]
MEKPEILIQTEREAVVYKPAGIATQLSDDVKGSSLESILKAELGKQEIFFPHRLDRVTRGLLIVAFDKETASYYGEQIKNGRIEKYYICEAENTGSIDITSLVGTHKRFIKTENGRSRIVKSGGKPSFLEIISIDPVHESKERYRVFIRLLTGRTHQIRVMLADMGIPLCGDRMYNPDPKYKDFYLEAAVLRFNDSDGKERLIKSEYINPLTLDLI